MRSGSAVLLRKAHAANSVRTMATVVRTRSPSELVACTPAAPAISLCTDADALTLRPPLQPKVKNLINGKFVDSATSDWIPLRDPVSTSGAAVLVEPPHLTAPFAVLLR